MIEELEKVCGEKFPPGDQLGSQESNDFLKAMLKKSSFDTIEDHYIGREAV